MGKHEKEQMTADGLPRSYPAPWKSAVLLACKRCQKKLRRGKRSPDFAYLRKWIKARSSKRGSRLHVIDIPCQDICPKGGLVVLTQQQLAAAPAEFCIVKTERQIEQLCGSANLAKDDDGI